MVVIPLVLPAGLRSGEGLHHPICGRHSYRIRCCRTIVGSISGYPIHGDLNRLSYGELSAPVRNGEMTAADKVLGDGIQPFQDMPREKQLRVSIWPPFICRQPLFKQPGPLRVVGLALDRLRLPELAELPVNREREHPSQHLSVTGLRKGLGPDHLTDLSAAVQQIGDGNADTQVRFLK